MFTKEETNFCKGIAIIMMLFHHLFNDYEEYAGFVVDYRPFSAERLTYLALMCKICVAVFVFLSGFGLTASYHKNENGYEKSGKKGIIHFVWNHFWKLMTAYWFVFLLTLLCQPLGRTVLQAYGTAKKEIILYFILDFFGLSYLFSTPTLNPTWWYMSLAIFIVFFIPFVIQLMKKYGAITVLVTMTAGIYLVGAANASTFYMFSLLLGSACYETGFFQKLEKIGSNSRKNILGVFEFFLLVFLLHYRTNYNFNGLVDGLIALTIASTVHTVFAKLPVISPVMQFLGKHSENIFMTHNQLYSFYFLSFFYSFKHWLLILMALLLSSLFLSIVLENVKRKSSYTKRMEKIGSNMFFQQ